VTGLAVTPYLTNEKYSMSQRPGLTISNGTFASTVPARSQVTYLIPVPAASHGQESPAAAVLPGRPDVSLAGARFPGAVSAGLPGAVSAGLHGAVSAGLLYSRPRHSHLARHAVE
jgi:hypothetical protein